MSTQHPDNVAMPFFAQSAPLTAEDEVREAYYAFSNLGCDEQMWDFEGKEVDGHVVGKLLSTYESFFAEHPIGESVHLTPRIPNPALEPMQAKIVLEVLQSLPRHADIARVFYQRERPPIVELIHPMTTSARELDRVREYYERFVAGMEQVTLGADEQPLGAWFGRFSPPTVRMIPSSRTASTSSRPTTSCATTFAAKSSITCACSSRGRIRRSTTGTSRRCCSRSSLCSGAARSSRRTASRSNP